MEMLKQAEKSAARDLATRRLAGTLGAEIEGVDLSQELDGETISGIRAALNEHCVLLFRGQDLDPAEQIRVASWLGEPFVHPIVPHLEGYPPVIVLDSQNRKNRGRTDFWHSDATFAERPPSVSILHSLIVPSAGGDTMFANQYLAYEDLSPGLRRMLDGLGAVHVPTGLATSVGKDPSEIPSSVHPVVRTHPETGRKALFVNVAFTSHFEDMTVEESEPLLRYLYEAAVRPEITFRHTWRVGDVLMWDNRCTQHYAIPDYDEHRLMHRVVVTGERPV